MDLVVFLPTYPNVITDLLLAVKKYYAGNAYIFCPPPVSKEDENRYKNGRIEKAFVVKTINDNGNIVYLIKSVIEEHTEAIYLFGGFFGLPGEALKIYANQYKGKNAFVFTEKPSLSPSIHFEHINKFIRILYSKYKYKKVFQYVEPAIKAIFVTGKKGVKQLEFFNFPTTKLYEIMYTHNDSFSIIPNNQMQRNQNVRFVYVGRFDFLSRGVDTLMDALDQLPAGSWSCDFVGGYGQDADAVIEWCKNNHNINYIGEWYNFDVINKLSEYDVCISPTRIDGWRIQINQAIVAGIGTITTTEAISDELIDISHAGVVIPPNNVKALKKAMEKVINNPEIIVQWKQNARNFRHLITNEVVGNYMNDVIKYCQNNQGERPKCPWLI